MARVALTTQVIGEPSLLPAFTPGTDTGATYTVDGDADHIEVVNAAGGAVAVTVETGGTLGGFALADKVVSVAAGTRRKIPLRDKRAYLRPTGVADGGKVYVNLDTVTSITVGAFR
jgi:hypothetical protein